MRTTLAAVVLAALSGAALATPLTLSYSISDDGQGGYRYHFTLSLDNHDGSWEPGQGFNWIIFGDNYPAPTALPNFVGDLPAPKPFDAPDEGFRYTGQLHHGPTLLDWGDLFEMTGWVPKFVGDSIHWSGTARVYVGQDQMLWSNIFGTGVLADFEPALFLGDGCLADFDGDGFVNGNDYDLFAELFDAADDGSDLNGDGFVNGNDYDLFATHFDTGC
ncbi:MAG: hypothetical protein U0638_09190 [Phycisphaerales bacterium]